MTKLAPIPASQVAAGKIRYSELQFYQDTVYWLESRPEEKGRCGLYAYRDNKVIDVLPKNYSLRSKVHEYGGGVYQFVGNNVYFVNAKDQCIYVQALTGSDEPCRLTQRSDKRFADFAYCEQWNCLIAVCEDHEPVNPSIEGEAETSLVAICCETGQVEPLVKGAAFYSDPRISPDGSKITWIDWNHPNMPWDHTRLWVADVLAEKYELDNPVQIAGLEKEAIVQVEWFDAETLRFASDQSSWWNLYSVHLNETSKQDCLYSDTQEYVRAPWNFAMKNYVSLSDKHIAGFTEADGRHQLYILDVAKQKKTEILSQFTLLESIAGYQESIYFIASGDAFAHGVWQYDLSSESLSHLAGEKAQSNPTLTIGQSIQYASGSKSTAYANLYLPETIPGKLPPLLVKAHGGPTGVAIRSLDWKTQFWTSRGFAVLDVNYRGSSGFGRDYREALYGRWGEVDVEDCIAGVNDCIAQGLVDKERVVISGGSAGGYTVLRALITSNVFAAGTSYYGVADLRALLADTHKFESRYLETCIAPLATHPERYDELSPINHVENIDCPMLFFQGLLDKVVPPNQTSMMVERLREKGNQVKVIEFPDEGHGFRSAEAIVESLEKEYWFYLTSFDVD